MSDYKHLGARKYFDLRYSLIPDNIIKQVIGTYTKTTYTTQHSYESDTINQCEITFKDGSTGITQIDFISPYTKDDYANIYREEVTYNESGYYRHITRTEKVAVRIVVNVYDELPIEFIDDEYALAFNDVDAKTYDRANGSLPLPPLDPTEDQWWYIDNNPDILWGPYNYNQPTAIGTGSRTESESSVVPLKSVTVDSYYNGKVLDSDTNMYRLRLEVEFYALKTDFDFQEAYNGVTGSMSMLLVKSFKLTVNYYVATTENVDFDIHTDDADYAQYPLKVTGNQYTSNETTFHQDHTDVPWYQYVSNLILKKYGKGKTFINSKLRASFLIDNNLDINSEVLIKDIDNQYISKEVIEDEEIKEYYLVFSIKNIEYVYSGSEFIANVVLLETGAVSPDISFGVHSYIVIDGSACIDVLNPFRVNALSINGFSSTAIIDVITRKTIQGIIDTAFDARGDALSIVNNSIEFNISFGAAMKIVAATIDIALAMFRSYLGFGTTTKAMSCVEKNVAFKHSAGFKSLFEAYSYTKVDTGFDTSSGFYINTPEVLSTDCSNAQFDAHEGFYVNDLEVICISQTDVNVLFESVFDMQGTITKDTVIETNIAASLFDFKANRLTKIDKIASANNKALSFLSSIGYSGSATMNKIGDRPIDNTYFFNWDISEFLDTLIEIDSENHTDGFLEIYLT